MPSSQSNLTRRNLTMDEQSFQSLLAAAFTIQEHNARQELELVSTDPYAERAPEQRATEQRATELRATEERSEEVAICQRCGAEKSSEELRCEACGLDDLRPGERMQRNWASMWLMSQEQRLWPERSNDSSLSASNFLATPLARQVAPEKEIAPTEAEAPKPTQRLDDASPSYTGVIQPRTSSPSEALGNADSASEGSTVEKRNRNNKNRGETRAVAGLDSPQEKFWPEAPGRKGLIAAEVVKTHRPNRVTDNRTEKSPAENVLDHEEIGWEPRIAHTRGDTSLTIVESFPEERAQDILGVPLPVHVSNNVSSSVPNNISTSVPNVAVSSPDLRDLRLTDLNGPNISAMLRQHRADLYLGAAIFVAVLALLWPSANSPKRSDLSLWDKTLIGMGIAEAPAPVAHLPGDPGVQVWIDPHTALYYCQGDELYGKAANGRFSTQREAQMERFEPASRAACE